jgi:hypothetical protein
MNEKLISFRDVDGSQWVIQSDGTYRMRNGDGSWSTSFLGMTVDQIAEEFGPLRSKQYSDDRPGDYKFLRRDR